MRLASRWWHGTLALVVLASLITQIVLTDDGGYVRLFSYFTIQSNVLVLIAAVGLALDPARDGRLWRIVRLDGLLGIAVTGLVYATVLAGLVDLHGVRYWANFGFHYFAPWWALGGWLLFGPRPRIDRRTLAWSLVWPACWIGWTVAHGAATGWFPYPFTDATEIGYPAALLNMGVVVLIAALFATVLRLLDPRLPAADTTRGATAAGGGTAASSVSAAASGSGAPSEPAASSESGT